VPPATPAASGGDRHTGDQRLQDRGGHLIHQRDDADLAEVQAQIRLDVRIDCRQQRLHHVVEQVTEADRQDHAEDRVVDDRSGGDSRTLDGLALHRIHYRLAG